MNLFEKLKEANEKLSLGIGGQNGAQEIDLLINDDWSYIAKVTICRDELVEIEQCHQVQNSPSELGHLSPLLKIDSIR